MDGGERGVGDLKVMRPLPRRFCVLWERFSDSANVSTPILTSQLKAHGPDSHPVLLGLGDAWASISASDFLPHYLTHLSVAWSHVTVSQPMVSLDYLLEAPSPETPVIGNQAGSYLTMKSNNNLIRFLRCILIKAIASHPSSMTKAPDMLGGLSWFGVPFAFASYLGLAARALLSDASTHEMDNIETQLFHSRAAQTSAGLTDPAAAAVVMGKGGAIAVLLVVFMAVTSVSSAELIGVSRLFSYDILQILDFDQHHMGASQWRVFGATPRLGIMERNYTDSEGIYETFDQKVICENDDKCRVKWKREFCDACYFIS
ncbi:hypothetical protein C8J56DRAFT_1027947 [Mycena floridula]|nr:hypothetical protein C8J56DRAFT_1027947 [Mycena floridula]